MKLTLDWLLARLSENSTWRGLILVATAAGAHWSPESANAIITAGLAVVGLINVIRKAPTQNETPSRTARIWRP